MNTLKPDWLDHPDILPYICIRPENHKSIEGNFSQQSFDWFHRKPKVINPLLLKNAGFIELQMKVDSIMFGRLSTPRWAFFDCGIMPGIITGFVMKRDKLPKEIHNLYKNEHSHEKWVPLSLFIVIPSMDTGQWVAHNLCSLNGLLPSDKRFRGLGFLSKAFGLWYANIQSLYGVTQWHSNALKLHTNFGDFELIATYNASHDHSHSVTYKCLIDHVAWKRFFDKQEDNESFDLRYQKTQFLLHPTDEDSLKSIQSRIEKDEGPFFLSGDEVLFKPLGEPLTLFTPRY